jgi:hypothetical protein
MLKLLKKHPLAKAMSKGKRGIKMSGFLRKLIPVPGINPMLTPGHGIRTVAGLFGKKH